MTLTPAQQQYHDLKQTVPDCILFFRLGDFYEVFYEDAKICSKVLDIVLTARNKNNPDPIPMAGIPYHSADKYIHKLIRHGYKIAIAEQTSQPTPGKIVSREITHIVTPATYLSETSKSTATIVAICSIPTTHGQYHLARGDFAIGEYATGGYETIEQALKQCMILSPQELIIDINLPERDHLHNHHYLTKTLMTVYDRPHNSSEYVRSIIGIQTLESYGPACASGRIDALGLLFNYLSYTQKHALSLVSRISYINNDQQLLIDETTLKNLEILTTSYDQSSTHSLLYTLDHTQTAMGSRLLKDRILHPSTNTHIIQERLNMIEHYVTNNDHCLIIIHHLKGLIDIPRLVSIIIQRTTTPSLLSKLRSALHHIITSPLYQEISHHHCSDSALQSIYTLHQTLQTSLKSDPVTDDSDYIADGIDSEIDRLRAIAYRSDDLLLAYQQYLIQHMNINNIKVKYIINQGYAIEITNKDIQAFEQACIKGDDKLDLVRRQTLKGSERYMSPYLDRLQQDIISAKDQLATAEKHILAQLKQQIQEYVSDLTHVSQAIGQCDVTTSMAHYARTHQYCKPQFDPSSEESFLDINGGRHPVVEGILPHHIPFIPNDLSFAQQAQTLGYDRSGHSQIGSHHSPCVHIITGPNMGGKSTYLRQNALIVLMAHCGLRVPAQSVRLSLFDGIFARIGSGDNQTKQQSTFMTEMIEVSNILNNATHRSLIVFDELGRGTSTYDGLALTESIIVHIATHVKAKTLVATHYHELIDLAETYPQIANYSVGVYETDKEVVFLKKIVAGGANKSYGIDVAKLAGISDTIIQQAKKRLTQLQQQPHTGGSHNTSPLGETSLRGQSSPQTLSKEHHQYHKLKQLLDSIIIDQTTPLQALGMIAKLKEEL